MKITESEYQDAVHKKEEAQRVIDEFFKQKYSSFKELWDRFEAGEYKFLDADLKYAAGARCKCGAGVAYPRECGPFHKWTCSDVLTGRKVDGEHEEFPFAFYDIKSEDQPSANGATTRP